MTVKLTDSVTIQLHGPSNQYIMQPHHLRRYTPSQQMDLNLVRIYLQVTILSDMSDPPARPNTIGLDFLDARRPQHWTYDSRWTCQETPSLSRRRLWERYLKSVYLRFVPFWKNPLNSGMRTKDP